MWYLTRGSGTVALLLLTASVLLGVANTTRWKTNRWPRFLVYGLHRNVRLLAVAFTGVHVVTSVIDTFAPIGILDAFVPFLSPYRPFWLGLGAVAFDLLLALVITSFLRRRIGTRAWKAVHWLAYGSWPVAMLHSSGTGSDAKQGWLIFLGFACGLTVLAAVVWRLVSSATAEPVVRAGALLATIGVLIGLVIWATNGPLERGWAARAGTPGSILHRFTMRQRTLAVRHTVSKSASLPAHSFRAAFQGRIAQQQTDRGLVIVTIDGSTTGGFRGRLHIALRGLPVDGGGVQMTDSVVALLPSGALAWSSGTVTGIAGTRLESTVTDPSRRAVALRIDLRLGSSDAVTGSIAGRPAS